MVVTLCGVAGLQSRAETRDDVLRQVPSQWREDIGRILDLAADEWNDGKLIAALQHYSPGTRKHRAICFLIAQMDSQLYVNYVNPDDPLNPFSPEEGVDWTREYIWDYGTMSAELLIENVEWAFLARETFPWCRALPEDIFFEYVLPYRSTQEPLHSWRPALYEDLAPMVGDLDSSLEITSVINSYNDQRFGFDPLYYRHPEDRDIFTCLAAGLGRCEDISNLSNYSHRAVGVPMASDFTPWWPKGDNNHAWNTVYDRGTWYTFSGSGPVPLPNTGQSTVYAKVYRKSFSAGPIMGPAPDGTMPPRLMRSSAIDVTSAYTTVSDIEIWVDNPDRATYLCVFNYGDWRAVGGAWAENDSVSFGDVGNKEILYCATRYIEDETGWGEHIPVSSPFILNSDGSIEYINPCPVSEFEDDITLTGWRDGGSLDAGSTVYLFRYIAEVPTGENGSESSEVRMVWKLMVSVTVEESDETVSAVFTEVALEGGLYLLSDSEDISSFREGSRPFVWKAGEITYY